MKKKIIAFVSMVFAILTLTITLVSCGKVEELIYDAPEKIAYDGSYITWSRCDNASYYTVSIDGGEEKRSNSTTYAYSTQTSFEVTINAVFNDTTKSKTVSFKHLATIESINVSDDGVLSWESVTDATAYAISVNGSVENISGTTYDKLKAGSNTIKVKPIVTGDSSYFAAYSKEISAYIYSAPTSLKYDGETLSWSGNASSYLVTINGVSKEVSGNYMTYEANNNDFSVEVKVIGDHKTTFDSKTLSDEFHYLDPVSEIKVEDGIVKWESASGATGYKIRVNGVEQKNTLTSCEYENLVAGKSQDISIKAINENGHYFSSYSSPISFYILETPTIKWNADLITGDETNNNITWNSVNASGGYSVRVTLPDGTKKVEILSSDLVTFGDTYKSVGEYKVEVKANANTANYYDSKYSTPIMVKRLASPKAVDSNYIVSNKDKLEAGFTVNFIKAAGAESYKLYKDGKEIQSTTNSSFLVTNISDETNISQQEITYTIKSIGGSAKTVSGVKYVTLPSLDSLSFNITVQATPQNLEMDGYKLSWSGSASDGYSVSYGGVTNTSLTTSYDLSTIKAGTYNLRVMARGNGSNILASNLSSAVTVKRLEVPKNFSITSNGEGTLQFDGVSDALSYYVYLGQNTQPLDGKTFANMYQYIDTTGTTIYMISVANYYSDNKTIYYMTSEKSQTQQFIKLAAPTFSEGSLSNSIELSWNAPSNINTSVYTPVYRLFSAKDEQIGGSDLNATKYNIEALEGGVTHKFLVKAIGDGTKYLDSDYSQEITAYKIETPTINISNNSYVWNSVASALSYYLEIDGVKVTEEFHVSGSTYSYTPSYQTEGEHSVKLKALGDGRVNGSIDSTYYTFTQIAKILSKPVISYKYSEKQFTTGGYVEVTVTTESKNASGYAYEIGGQTIILTSTIGAKVIESAGKISIRVKAKGGTFDEDNIYYIDSAYVGGSSTDYINILPAPSKSSFKINSDGFIKFDNVSSSYGYEYYIYYNDEENDTLNTTKTNSITVSNYKTYKKITIKLRAKGDSTGKTVSSAWVEWTWEQ